VDTYFTKQVDDDGNETYVEAELPATGVADIPDDSFYQDPRYRSVADSDAQRRIKIRELRQELKSLADVDEETGEGDDRQPTDPVPAAPPVATDELVASVLATLKAEQQKEQNAANERRTLIDGLMDKHKLPEDLRGALESSNDPEAVASVLGPAVLKFDNVPGGDAETVNEVDAIMARVNEGLGFDEPSS